MVKKKDFFDEHFEVMTFGNDKKLAQEIKGKIKKLLPERISTSSYHEGARGLLELQEKRKRYQELNKKHGFFPCPNKSWHHLGTTCEICGLKG